MKKLLIALLTSFMMINAAQAVTITINGMTFNFDEEVNYSELYDAITAIKENVETSVLKELGVTNVTVATLYGRSVIRINDQDGYHQTLGEQDESKFDVFYRSLDEYLEKKQLDWQAGFNAGLADGIASVTFLQSSYDSGFTAGQNDIKNNDPLYNNEDGVSQSDVDAAVAAVKAEDYYFESGGEFENAAVSHITSDLYLEGHSVVFGGDELLDVSSVYN